MGLIAGVFHQLKTEMPRNTNWKPRRGESVMVASCACGEHFGMMFTADAREAAYAAHVERAKAAV
jgi:hypothetical protein